MTSYSTIYLLTAAGFVCIANLIALSGLWINYSSSRKPYLAIACVAALLETMRQIPDFLISAYPESILLYQFSGLLQFLASLTFLYALWSKHGKLVKWQRLIFVFLFISCLASVFYQVANGLLESRLYWYIATTPVILTTALIVWVATRSPRPFSSGSILLALASVSLLSLRIATPAVEELELYYLVYFIEVLFFPMMLSALILSEIETTQRDLVTLLDDREQSKNDLQFILDNSLDIIFLVNEFGLLLSWSNRAEGLFGYNAEHIIGKVHIDELFSGTFQHRNSDEFLDFEATMENLDGTSLPITARSKTVYRDDRTYSIYVIKGDTAESVNERRLV